MKINKNFVLFLVLLAFTFSTSFVFAKVENKNSNNSQKPTPAVNAKYLKETIEKIETVKPKIKTPVVKQELETIQEEQIISDKTIDDSLSKISTRSGLAKLVIGPDYKNAGAVRSEIVHLQNQVRQLTRLETKASTTEKTAIQASVASLNQELVAIETRLSESLKGFSLFGWLNKLLTGFVAPTPAVTPTPTVVPTGGEPTTVPTAVPTGGEPTTVPTVTVIPTITVAPTEIPTVTP